MQTVKQVLMVSLLSLAMLACTGCFVGARYKALTAGAQLDGSGSYGFWAASERSPGEDQRIYWCYLQSKQSKPICKEAVFQELKKRQQGKPYRLGLPPVP